MSEQSNKDMSKHFYRASAADFMKIPGSPVAYSASTAIGELFRFGTLARVADTRLGMATGDNDKFLRRWYEVNSMQLMLDAIDREDAKKSGKKWFPYQKGGDFRKWYGNNEYCVNWEADGKEIRNFKDISTNRVRSHNYNLDYIFLEGITWNALTSGKTAARYSNNSLFDNSGSSLFIKGNDVNLESVLAFINSNIMSAIFPLISPTLNYQPGDISKLPAYFPDELQFEIKPLVRRLIDISKVDWNASEISCGFLEQPLVSSISERKTVRSSFSAFVRKSNKLTEEVLLLEEKINSSLITHYSLNEDVTFEVNLKDVSLTCNPYYRYRGSKDIDCFEDFMKSDSISELISYAIGCMMGRYSFDKPGLILASQGETTQDYLAQIPSPRFMPDDDAILPLTDQEWFTDDVTNRFREFVKVVWGEDTLQENLEFVAESLCLHAIKPKKSETAMETIRRYLSTQFFADHMKTYKKRPIYWLFSSGKQKAFECLVYLHRYNEGTLSRMRTEYVTPLMGKYESQIRHIEEQQETASTAEKNKLSKALKGYQSKLNELREFDNKLKHYADRRISLDLDDGVKVNYGKFGDLLAKVKEITGKAPITD